MVKRLLPIFLILLSAIAWAEPQITTREQYYDIQGQTKEALRADMMRKSPGGGRYFGDTQWQVKWNYRTEMNGGACGLTNFVVTEEVVVILPKWTDEASAPGGLRKDWDKFIKALKEHEEGHLKTGLEAAHDVEGKILEAAAKQTDCRRVSSAANAAGTLTLAKYNQKDIQYDQKTQHGKTQGAIF